jgi:hypothetical protein
MIRVEPTKVESLLVATHLFNYNKFSVEDKKMLQDAVSLYTSKLHDDTILTRLNPLLNLSWYTQHTMFFVYETDLYFKNILLLLEYLPHQFTSVHTISEKTYKVFTDEAMMKEYRLKFPNIRGPGFSKLVREWYLDPNSADVLVFPLHESTASTVDSSSSLAVHAVLGAVFKPKDQGNLKTIYINSHGYDIYFMDYVQSIITEVVQKAVPEVRVTSLILKCPPLQSNVSNCVQWQMLFFVLFLMNPHGFEDTMNSLQSSDPSKENMNIILFQLFMFFVLMSFNDAIPTRIYYEKKPPKRVEDTNEWLQSDTLVRSSLYPIFPIHDCEAQDSTYCASVPDCYFCETKRRCVHQNMVKTKEPCELLTAKDVVEKLLEYHRYFVERGLLPMQMEDLRPEMYMLSTHFTELNTLEEAVDKNILEELKSEEDYYIEPTTDDESQVDYANLFNTPPPLSPSSDSSNSFEFNNILPSPSASASSYSPLSPSLVSSLSSLSPPAFPVSPPASPVSSLSLLSSLSPSRLSPEVTRESSESDSIVLPPLSSLPRYNSAFATLSESYNPLLQFNVKRKLELSGSDTEEEDDNYKKRRSIQQQNWSL